MTAPTSDLSSVPTSADISAALETLASLVKRPPGEAQEHRDLRRRAVLSLQRLVPELESPEDTAQRLFYNVRE